MAQPTTPPGTPSGEAPVAAPGAAPSAPSAVLPVIDEKGREYRSLTEGFRHRATELMVGPARELVEAVLSRGNQWEKAGLIGGIGRIGLFDRERSEEMTPSVVSARDRYAKALFATNAQTAGERDQLMLKLLLDRDLNLDTMIQFARQYFTMEDASEIGILQHFFTVLRRSPREQRSQIFGLLPEMTLRLVYLRAERKESLPDIIGSLIKLNRYCMDNLVTVCAELIKANKERPEVIERLMGTQPPKGADANVVWDAVLGQLRNEGSDILAAYNDRLRQKMDAPGSST